MKKRKDSPKKRALREAWADLLKRHDVTITPRITKKTFAPLQRLLPTSGLKPSGTSTEEFKQRLLQSDKTGSENGDKDFALVAVNSAELELRLIAQYAAIYPDLEAVAMAGRELEARKVKYCVMPLHKGGYVLVTDASLVPQMGKKTA